MSTPREKLLQQFREQVLDRVAKVSRSLMALEAGPDLDAGKTALRELHGLKGEARMMGFAEINLLVHEMEELIRVAEPVRFSLTSASVDALLASCDALGVLSGATAGTAPDGKKLIDWVTSATARERERSGTAASDPPAPLPSLTPALVPRPEPFVPPPPPHGLATEAKARPVDASLRITQQSLETLTTTAGNLSQRSRNRDSVGVKRKQLAREMVQLHRLAEDLGPVADDLAQRLGRAKEALADINRTLTGMNSEELRDLLVLTEEIQALRMVRIGELFELYPRMVRELARDLGKELDVVFDGRDELADRSVLDALKEPLMHLVRNAIDHGLESREERVDSGKSPRGTLRLEAARDGERLVVRVGDDGRGLEPSLLRAVAVRQGLLSAEAAGALSDAEANELIFKSGFTSKQTASDVSGRGIGLDVVRLRLLQMGGEVTVSSTPGFGTTFELRVPLSLTLAPVVFIEAGGERLSVTAANVVGVRPVEAANIRELDGRPGLVVDDTVLPFATIAAVMGVAPERAPVPDELVLVLTGRGQQAAFAIDRVLGEQVQPILPMKGLLAAFAHVSGATPQADGTLSLVLSAQHLVATAHGRAVRVGGRETEAAPSRKSRILVVDDSPLTRELLVTLLEGAGYSVLQAADGAQALAVMGHESIDLLATDLEMPVLDGVELTAQVRARVEGRAMPIVIVTTRGSATDRDRGLEAGASAYLMKGDLLNQELLDVVARLLAQRYRA